MKISLLFLLCTMISANTFGADCVVKDEIKASQYYGSDYQVDNVRAALIEAGCDVRVNVARKDATHLIRVGSRMANNARCAFTDAEPSMVATIKLINIDVTSEGRVILTDNLSATGKICGSHEDAVSKAAKKLTKLINKKML